MDFAPLSLLSESSESCRHELGNAFFDNRAVRSAAPSGVFVCALTAHGKSFTRALQGVNLPRAGDLMLGWRRIPEGHWIAREGLSSFSRMSDGRDVRGPPYEQFRAHFKLNENLDICAAIYGADAMQRSQFSQLAKLVATAALSGDELSQQIFVRGAGELAAMIDAVRHRLTVPAMEALPVSYSGSVFQTQALCLLPLQQRLTESHLAYELRPPRLPPDAGAAVYAAKLNAHPLKPGALQFLVAQLN